jgi:hypothetical protein
LTKVRAGILQNPVLSPTEKQLASWLKEADKATGLLELSIAGLVFMIAVCSRLAATDTIGFGASFLGDILLKKV